MFQPATMHARIIETLYCEALVLVDEAALAFTLPTPGESDAGATPSPASEAKRAALCGEGMRTTTRMTHAIAWLLNRRSRSVSDIGMAPPRRHGRLSAALRHSDPDQVALLDPATGNLIEASVRFYDRLLRLDQAWRLAAPKAPNAIRDLRETIACRLAG